jgi:hypothetical protein
MCLFSIYNELRAKLLETTKNWGKKMIIVHFLLFENVLEAALVTNMSNFVDMTTNIFSLFSPATHVAG